MMHRLRRPPAFRAVLLALAATAAAGSATATDYPITPGQRATAQQVAQAGVPLSELAPNAPDSHTVKPGDTLWDISQLFLRSPWRWPELWGMNLDQIRNPHLIYPGQVLVLEKVDGRARLRMGAAVGSGGEPPVVKLSPRVRSQALPGPIASIPMHLIAAFLDEAVVLDTNSLAAAPRIVAGPEGRVVMGTGDTVYARGELEGVRSFRLFREPRPLRDPATGQVLGWEARYVGRAELQQPGGTMTVSAKDKPLEQAASLRVISNRMEVSLADRLAPVVAQDFSAYAPHPPAAPLSGQIVGLYGDALNGGQNQIVSLNRGSADGVERGHVLALWRSGAVTVDRTDPKRERMKLPDERHGLLFVFSVFERVSYALILQVQQPVVAGDRFTQP
ncbi:LysM domain-containing protein [Aquabacterium sp. J223]|uniref:LysM peptidoglycan-binding domain-containing protein n=1 Tax=Aquabacterium sp. J223 TaxID=2898431 RepID=UPI0028A092CE|nr:LysM domain-containing protein [Aquabacterium sp. J223]